VSILSFASVRLSKTSNDAMQRTAGSLGSTFHELATSTRSHTPPRQPSLIFFSLDA
jgi:hypothetical protein